MKGGSNQSELSEPSCDQRGLPAAAILSELLQRENRVLHFWTLKKRRLDQCQQYVVFERSAKQVCAECSLALPQLLGRPEKGPSGRQNGTVGGRDEERKGKG